MVIKKNAKHGARVAAWRMKLTGPACTEMLSEAEEAGC